MTTTNPPNPNTRALLDKALKVCEPPTLYRLSKNTGIANTTLSRCINRGGTLDNEGALRLAKFLGMDPLEIIAYSEADRAARGKSRAAAKKQAFWEGRLPRICATVTATFALAVSGINQAKASQGSEKLSKSESYALYIMRTI